VSAQEVKIYGRTAEAAEIASWILHHDWDIRMQASVDVQ
jgi:CRISPR/Cas system-associated endonuclease Cas3-HD